MSVERNLPIVRERKLAILKGDPELCDKQKKAGKLLARERVAQLFDAASFVELDVLNADAGVVTGYGLIDEKPVYVYAQDFTVKGGSVGAQHARKILKVMDLAEKTGAPLVAILDTAGARLDEGLDAMNAYAMIAGRVSALSGVVPQVTLVLGHCGGTASAIAGMSDIVVMSKNGSLFVNGPRVVSAVAGKELSLEDIGGTSASVRSGMAQLTAETDEEAIALARKVVAMLPANNMDEAVDLPRDDMNRELAAAQRHRQGGRRARRAARRCRSGRHRRTGRGLRALDGHGAWQDRRRDRRLHRQSARQGRRPPDGLRLQEGRPLRRLLRLLLHSRRSPWSIPWA